MWRMGALEVEAEIYFFSTSDQGGAGGHLEPSQLRDCVEKRRVVESTADEIALGSKIQQHQQIFGGCIM